MTDAAPRLHLVISPYSLCSHDAAAMAGLLLAGQALTFLPRSLAAVPVDRGRALHSAGYRQVIASVAWATPLVESGVLATSVAGEDAAPDFAEARRRVATDADLAPLRRFVETRIEHDPDRALDRLASDLTRSGPDPSISVPLAAALDALAERHAYTVLRTDGPSLAQQAERARERRLFACSVPVLVQASTERLIETRRRLAPELDALREAAESCLDGLADESAVREAAADYADAYDRSRHHIERPEEDPDDPQVRSAEIVLAGVAHAPDHALACSAMAARRVSSRPSEQPQPSSLTARSLIVRLVGR